MGSENAIAEIVVFEAGIEGRLDGDKKVGVADGASRRHARGMGQEIIAGNLSGTGGCEEIGVDAVLVGEKKLSNGHLGRSQGC